MKYFRSCCSILSLVILYAYCSIIFFFAEFSADIVFAIDCSSFVQDEDKKKQVEYIQHLAELLNVAPGKSRASVIAYGDTADVMIDFESSKHKPFSIQTLRTDQFLNGKSRRLDLTLAKATSILKAEEMSLLNDQQKKIVILFTTGNQGVEKDSLQSSSEEIHQLGYQLIVVPVGISIDFKELSMMIKRPQSLFPLLSLDTSKDGIERMAMEIRTTSGLLQFLLCHFYHKLCLYPSFLTRKIPSSGDGARFHSFPRFLLTF